MKQGEIVSKNREGFKIPRSLERVPIVAVSLNEFVDKLSSR